MRYEISLRSQIFLTENENEVIEVSIIPHTGGKKTVAIPLWLVFELGPLLHKRINRELERLLNS